MLSPKGKTAETTLLKILNRVQNFKSNVYLYFIVYVFLLEKETRYTGTTEQKTFCPPLRINISALRQSRKKLFCTVSL